MYIHPYVKSLPLPFLFCSMPRLQRASRRRASAALGRNPDRSRSPPRERSLSPPALTPQHDTEDPITALRNAMEMRMDAQDNMIQQWLQNQPPPQQLLAPLPPMPAPQQQPLAPQPLPPEPAPQPHPVMDPSQDQQIQQAILQGSAMGLTLNPAHQDQRGGEVSAYLVLGATLDPKIKAKIWSNQYVDLTTLTSMPQAPSVSVTWAGQQPSIAMTQSHASPPASYNEWLRLFNTYAAIYFEAHPNEAGALVGGV